MTRERSAAGPKDWLARLQEVRETGDRRASPALLELFLDPHTDDDRRTEIARTLRALEDLRCAAPLRRAVFDTSLPCLLRSLAFEVHSAIPVDVPPREELLRHAHAPDPVIRAFGVRQLDVPDGETIAAAVQDPEPLVRYAAVDAMASIVRTPPLVLATRRALLDEDAAVREAACRVALFDEPLDATHELVQALEDPSTGVRIAACDALEDFPRVSVLLALAEARGESDAGLAAHLAFEGVAARVHASLAEASPRAKRRLERWVEPVKWLLTETWRDLLDELTAASAEQDEPPAAQDVDLDEAAEVLADPDASAAEQRRMLVAHRWAGAGDRGREVLRACAASPNWSIRQSAAYAFGDLGAAEDLLALAADREPVVRRAALEELRASDEPRGLAAARDTLADPAMRPTAGDDALALVAELGSRREAERTILAELARPQDRDGLHLGAIHMARHFEIEAAVPHLQRIVQSPVTASVLPHVGALAALRGLGRRGGGLDLSHLEALDHLEVQRELGEWGWKGARYG